MKSQKAEKAIIDAEVKSLLGLKAEYKSLTGKDWTPGTVAPAKQVESKGTISDENTLLQKISTQGEKVRDLKSKKAEKAAVDAEV